MGVLSLITEPSPVLHKVCAPVQKTTRRTRALLDDMVKTMRAHQGLGLAAPQVGVPERLIVATDGAGRKVYRLVNPTVLSASGALETTEEGCLSLPGYVGDVARPSLARVAAHDEWGTCVMIFAEGLLARCLLHEIDHLDGILYTARLVPGTALRSTLAREA